MRLTIAAIGRMKAGPERELVMRYLDRLARSGPVLGLEWAGVSEFPESRAASAPERKREEAAHLRSATPERAALILLDERGKARDSDGFAADIAAWRDEGLRDAVFAIGGPDGLDPDLRAEARASLCFGAMTWPHQIVRILLAEQLYRAATILSGHPYHRA